MDFGFFRKPRLDRVQEDFRKLGVGFVLAGVLGILLKEIYWGGGLTAVVGLMFWLSGLSIGDNDES